MSTREPERTPARGRRPRPRAARAAVLWRAAAGLGLAGLLGLGIMGYGDPAIALSADLLLALCR